MNDLTSMKQRFISALDKSDTSKEFIFNIFEEVYQQGYEDGRKDIDLAKKALEEQKEEKWVSVTEAWMMEELENQIKEGKGCLGRDEE